MTKIKFDNYFRPCNDVVFSIMFGNKKFYSLLVESIIGAKIDVQGEPMSQATKFEKDVLTKTIRFDVLAQTEPNGKLYSLDMQRRYYRQSIEYRASYYGMRVISRQNVDDMKYNSIYPVHVIFIFAKDSIDPLDSFTIQSTKTHRLFADRLFEVTFVSVPAVLNSEKFDKFSDLYIFSSFFGIASQEEADQFSLKYGENILGKELIALYNKTTTNHEELEATEKSEYFSRKLTEEEIQEAAKYWVDIIVDDKVAEAKAEAKAEAMAEAKAEANAEVERIKAEVSKLYGLPFEKVLEAAKKLDSET
jgi:hypothetical protein